MNGPIFKRMAFIVLQIAATSILQQMFTSVDMAIGLSEKRYATVEVYKNGEPVSAEVSKYGVVKVTVADIDYSAEYTVKVTYSTLDPLADAKRTALTKLMTVEGAQDVRKNLSKDIETKCMSIETVKNMIIRSNLSLSEKARLTESL